MFMLVLLLLVLPLLVLVPLLRLRPLLLLYYYSITTGTTSYPTCCGTCTLLVAVSVMPTEKTNAN